MFAPRLIGTTTGTVIGALGLLGAAWQASATAPPTTAASVDVSVTAVPCEIVDSEVDSELATFTVGPEGCTGEVGPISFSTYELPGGQILPYEDQVLIADAVG